MVGIENNLENSEIQPEENENTASEIIRTAPSGVDIAVEEAEHLLLFDNISADNIPNKEDFIRNNRTEIENILRKFFGNESIESIKSKNNNNVQKLQLAWEFSGLIPYNQTRTKNNLENLPQEEMQRIITFRENNTRQICKSIGFEDVEHIFLYSLATGTNGYGSPTESFGGRRGIQNMNGKNISALNGVEYFEYNSEDTHNNTRELLIDRGDGFASIGISALGIDVRGREPRHGSHKIGGTCEISIAGVSNKIILTYDKRGNNVGIFLDSVCPEGIVWDNGILKIDREKYGGKNMVIHTQSGWDEILFNVVGEHISDIAHTPMFSDTEIGSNYGSGIYSINESERNEILAKLSEVSVYQEDSQLLDVQRTASVDKTPYLDTKESPRIQKIQDIWNNCGLDKIKDMFGEGEIYNLLKEQYKKLFNEADNTQLLNYFSIPNFSLGEPHGELLEVDQSFATTNFNRHSDGTLPDILESVAQKSLARGRFISSFVLVRGQNIQEWIEKGKVNFNVNFGVSERKTTTYIGVYEVQ